MCCCNHPTEIFEVQPVGGLNVKILGLPTPSGDRLELSVVEDTMGVPDRFPRFRQSDIEVKNQTTNISILCCFMLQNASEERSALA